MRTTSCSTARCCRRCRPSGSSRFVALLDEFWDEFDSEKVPHSFTVNRRDERGRFLADPLSQYRHPDRALIGRFRKPKDGGKP